MRHPRIDGPGVVSHVGARVNWQKWLLGKKKCMSIFFEELNRVAEEFGVTVLGHVVMSNHFHLVVQSPDKKKYRELTSYRTPRGKWRRYPKGHQKALVLSQFMHQLMWRVSRRAQRALKQKGRFWEDRFHSRVLADSSELVIALAYDHLNPVKSGQVDAPEEYLASSASWWADRTPNPVALLTDKRLPFGLTRSGLRRRVLRRQQAPRFVDATERLRSDGHRIDTRRGWARLCHLLTGA